jgi:hypothetical protein
LEGGEEGLQKEDREGDVAGKAVLDAGCGGQRIDGGVFSDGCVIDEDVELVVEVFLQCGCNLGGRFWVQDVGYDTNYFGLVFFPFTKTCDFRL